MREASLGARGDRREPLTFPDIVFEGREFDENDYTCAGICCICLRVIGRTLADFFCCRSHSYYDEEEDEEDDEDDEDDDDDEEEIQEFNL